VAPPLPRLNQPSAQAMCFLPQESTANTAGPTVRQVRNRGGQLLEVVTDAAGRIISSGELISQLISALVRKRGLREPVETTVTARSGAGLSLAWGSGQASPHQEYSRSRISSELQGRAPPGVAALDLNRFRVNFDFATLRHGCPG
jgi:hypothetical protein